MIHIEMNEEDKEFIWNLLSTYWILDNRESAINLARNIFENSKNLPDDIEASILKFSSSHMEVDLCEVALYFVARHYFDPKRHIILVSVLVEKNTISINRASDLIKGITQVEGASTLNDKIKKVIDIAWLINEDSKDKIMDAESDNMLVDALNEVIVEARLEQKE
tara:strand:- start:121 stop:615 length:495 start_codon:yes stop_codon:yes gene_type:complete